MRIITDQQIRDVKTRALEYGVSEPVGVARLVVDEFVGNAEIAELIQENPSLSEEQALDRLMRELAERIAKIDDDERATDP
jgi:hypothetical protein